MRRRDLLLTPLLAALPGERPRRPVVPEWVIREFGLKPGTGLSIMGYDAQYYALDDVLAAIFELLGERRPIMKQRQK